MIQTWGDSDSESKDNSDSDSSESWNRDNFWFMLVELIQNRLELNWIVMSGILNCDGA